MEVTNKPRVVGVVMGDIAHEPSSRVKYGFFFEALAQQFALIAVYNAQLSGSAKLLNALQTFHPQKRVWHERFYKNIAAFQARSRQITTRLQKISSQADVVIQVGVLFDAGWGHITLPNIVYTDYTAQLSAQKPDLGRSPFTATQRKAWIALEQQAFTRAAHICTRSHHVRRSILADYGIAPDKVTVIGGGANFASLPEEISRPENKPPTALFIGQEFYRKGGDLLLRAFAQARAQLPTARLLVMTADSIPPDLPLAGVELIKPTWDRAELARIYRQADLLVLPSRLETWGDVLLEAMAYQLPCIGVTGESMEEIIQNEVTGLIVPSGDIDALTSALVRLAGSASLRVQFGRAGRQKLEQEATWPCVVERLTTPIELAMARHVNRRQKERLRES